jgi:hypothetical protein
MSLGALSRDEWRERSDQDDVEPADGSEVVGRVVVGGVVVGGVGVAGE